MPGRLARPERLVVVLRGIPGSGKSHVARAIRDLEVGAGAEPPRIHSLDDYFTVDSDSDDDGDDKRGSRARPAGDAAARPDVSRAPRYNYDAAMEPQYRALLMKSFARTLQNRHHSLVVLDAPNLTVAELQGCLTACSSQRYEGLVLEAPVRDPAEAAAQGVHGRSQREVEEACARLEPCPSYIQQIDPFSIPGLGNKGRVATAVDGSGGAGGGGAPDEDAVEVEMEDEAPPAPPTGGLWDNDEDEDGASDDATNARRRGTGSREPPKIALEPTTGHSNGALSERLAAEAREFRASHVGAGGADGADVGGELLHGSARKRPASAGEDAADELLAGAQPARKLLRTRWDQPAPAQDGRRHPGHAAAPTASVKGILSSGRKAKSATRRVKWADSSGAALAVVAARDRFGPPPASLSPIGSPTPSPLSPPAPHIAVAGFGAAHVAALSWETIGEDADGGGDDAGAAEPCVGETDLIGPGHTFREHVDAENHKLRALFGGGGLHSRDRELHIQDDEGGGGLSGLWEDEGGGLPGGVGQDHEDEHGGALRLD
ncbi:unnamed protein product [Pedinophyceae sp. YPF-701]|nr:unnamed protein product [Pedinophyceae sp. YPF-701]